MPISVEWENPAHTIIYSAFIGPWTWTEHHHALRELAGMLHSVSQTVHVINSIEQAHLPMGPVVFPRLSMLWDVVPPNLGLLVNVTGKNLPGRLVLEMAQRTSLRAAVSIRIVESMDDAYTLLAREAGIEMAAYVGHMGA